MEEKNLGFGDEKRMIEWEKSETFRMTRHSKRIEKKNKNLKMQSTKEGRTSALVRDESFAEWTTSDTERTRIANAQVIASR